MSRTRCDRCGGKAIFIGSDGSWRCVVCNPKEFKWNKDKRTYEGQKMDNRYITEEYDNGIKITMKVYKEWVDENGEATVYHKTDIEGFKSPLVKEQYE